MLTRLSNRYSSPRSIAAWLPAVAVASMLVCATVADATVVHRYESSFGEKGSLPGQLSEPQGVAVNDSTASSTLAGDVYVLDAGNNRVERFSASGVFLGWFDGSGTYEVEGKVEKGSAAPTGKLSETKNGILPGIAVDDSGNPLDLSAEDVYVVDQQHAVVDKFSATGAYIGQIDGSETALGRFDVEASFHHRVLEGVAVDPKGTLWIGINATAGFSPHAPVLFGFNDETVNRLISEVADESLSNTGMFGVDGEDNFYVPERRWYSKYGKTGEVSQVPFGGLEYPEHINGQSNPNVARVAAVDASHQEVYLDSGVKIEAFTLAGEPVESDERSEASFPSFGLGLISVEGSFGIGASLGLAVNTSSGAVYATNSGTGQVLVFEALALPDATIGALGARGTRGVTMSGTVNPEGMLVTGCVFEYDTRPYGKGEGPHGTKVACSPASVGSGTSPVPVSATISGLTPQSTYYYRLVAENSAGRSTSAGKELFTGPRLGGESVLDVASGSATLEAPVDPNGADTHYYVEYGPTVAYGSFAPVERPGVDLGSVAGQQLVMVHLQGLQAGTTYHYRFVVAQDGEAFEEPDNSFTTQSPGAGLGLLDGRAWELVSPANKKGALIELFEQGGQVQAASDGSGIAYISQGTAVGANPQGKISYAQVLSRRGPAGWRSDDLTLPNRLPENGEPSVRISSFNFEYDLFSLDLSLAAVEPQLVGTPPLPPVEPAERTLYLRDDNSGSFLPLVTAGNVPSGTHIEEPSLIGAGAPEIWEMHFLAATPDLSHVVFKTPMALTPEAIDEESIQKKLSVSEVQWNLYEWGGGRLQLVNILPGNERVAHGPESAVPGVRLAGIGSYVGLPRGGAQRSMSSDGRRVAWAWGESYSRHDLESYKGLYVRDMVEGRTVRVGGSEAIYQTMNSDGTRIFYLEDGELYVYEWGLGAEAGTTIDLTTAHGTSANAGVQPVIADVSEDGSYVYFVATSVLTSGGVSGQDNLYLLHDTAGGWTTTFIATLSPKDRPSWYGGNTIQGSPSLPGLSSRVSPDGRYLAFMSERSLTGYDNLDAVSGQPDEEVYMYDAQSERIMCVSCNPTGARPVGIFDSAKNSERPLVDRQAAWTADRITPEDPHYDHWLAGSVPGWDEHNGSPATYQPRYLSDSGRLFFDSPDALVPQATNGLADVYEYEPAGVGTCVVGDEGFSERSNGCIGLVSSGTSSSESAFMDASENGNDVFFVTTGKLVGEDYDKGYDVYDAHVCGAEGVPCRTGVVNPPPCNSGDSCKAAPSPQPELFGPAPSATFNGIGNATVPAATRVAGRSPTNAQKLARALRACHKQRGGRRRSCEARALRRYPLKRASGTARDTRKGGR